MNYEIGCTSPQIEAIRNDNWALTKDAPLVLSSRKQIKALLERNMDASRHALLRCLGTLWRREVCVIHVGLVWREALTR